MRSYMYENKKDISKMEMKPTHITYHSDHVSFLIDNNGQNSKEKAFSSKRKYK